VPALAVGVALEHLGLRQPLALVVEEKGVLRDIGRGEQAAAHPWRRLRRCHRAVRLPALLKGERVRAQERGPYDSDRGKGAANDVSVQHSGHHADAKPARQERHACANANSPEQPPLLHLLLQLVHERRRGAAWHMRSSERSLERSPERQAGSGQSRETQHGPDGEISRRPGMASCLAAVDGCAGEQTTRSTSTLHGSMPSRFSSAVNTCKFLDGTSSYASSRVARR
jgi:hypothetical protein